MERLLAEERKGTGERKAVAGGALPRVPASASPVAGATDVSGPSSSSEWAGGCRPPETLCVSPDPDVPALEAAARLPQGPVRPPGGARDRPQPLCGALVPHRLRLAVPPGLRRQSLR